MKHIWSSGSERTPFDDYDDDDDDDNDSDLVNILKIIGITGIIKHFYPQREAFQPCYSRSE